MINSLLASESVSNVAASLPASRVCITPASTVNVAALPAYPTANSVLPA